MPLLLPSTTVAAYYRAAVAWLIVVLWLGSPAMSYCYCRRRHRPRPRRRRRVAATTPFLAGRLVLFPQCGKLTPSPALAMGYRLRAVVGATTQLNTGRRNMKLPEGDILIELAADMKNIFFSVLAVYSGIGGTLIVKILMHSKLVKGYVEDKSVSEIQ